MNKPLQLFLSHNFAYLERRSLFTAMLEAHFILFEDLGPLATFRTAGALALVTKDQVKDRMLKSDCYVVMADRYDAMPSLSELELNCAFFLDVPVLVIQPWSCWSVPKPLKDKAWRIINWEREDITAALQQVSAHRAPSLALAH